MAAIALTTAGQLALVDPEKAIVKSRIAGATIALGQALYLTAAGKVDLCDANAAGLEQFAGLALNVAAAGQAVDCLEDGEVAGFNLAALAYGASVFVNDTPGVLDTVVSITKAVRVGRVVPKSDPAMEKVLAVHVNHSQVW